ncbi:MAG: hypothetical protein HQM16_04070 [Deltaproteobacteria bacterium]|nr:hypothetical protein [Deltaproteobacteria bacterium]
MSLLVIALIVFALTGIWLYRDRRYLRKDIRAVAGDQTKKLLNIPTRDDKFPVDFKKHRSGRTASKKILEKMNERGDVR